MCVCVCVCVCVFLFLFFLFSGGQRVFRIRPGDYQGPGHQLGFRVYGVLSLQSIPFCSVGISESRIGVAWIMYGKIIDMLR